MNTMPWYQSIAVRLALSGIASGILLVLRALGLVHWPDAWDARAADIFAGVCIAVYAAFELRRRVKQGNDPTSPMPPVTLTKRP